MPLPPLLHARFLRLVAIAVSVLATSNVLGDAIQMPSHIDLRFLAWLGAYLAYVIALWLSFGDAPSAQSPRRKLALLAVQGVAPFVMLSLIPCYYGGLLLVIVAWQAALLLSPVAAVAWVAAQMGLITIVQASSHWRDFGSLFAYLGFQVFALITAAATRREATFRAELAQANAELRATRAILADSSRLGERMRIARDLHDLLGHHLTALSLNLEVASHAPPEKSAEHVAKSKEITRQLLGDLRDVVSTLRSTDGVQVRRVLQMLVRDVSDLEVKLEMPRDLCIECAERAQALVRCVQEIVTNTRKHACARKLFIKIALENGEIVVHAHDDGRGAGEVRAGHGLRGMRERFEEIGGCVTAGARPEGGFAVDARLPLAGDA
jgi:signal transduction histidine kinase